MEDRLNELEFLIGLIDKWCTDFEIAKGRQEIWINESRLEEERLMINITKHALKRYVERFVDPDKTSTQDLININKELYEKELVKMFEQSKHLLNGRFNEKLTQTSYWLADDIILVTDTEHTKIITLYRIEYGFSRSINKSILHDLLIEHEISKEKYIQIMRKNSNEKDTLLNSRDNLDIEIESLEKTLKSLKESKKSLDDYISNFECEVNKAKSEMNVVAQKIVYSIN